MTVPSLTKRTSEGQRREKSVGILGGGSGHEKIKTQKWRGKLMAKDMATPDCWCCPDRSVKPSKGTGWEWKED